MAHEEDEADAGHPGPPAKSATSMWPEEPQRPPSGSGSERKRTPGPHLHDVRSPGKQGPPGQGSPDKGTARAYGPGGDTGRVYTEPARYHERNRRVNSPAHKK